MITIDTDLKIDQSYCAKEKIANRQTCLLRSEKVTRRDRLVSNSIAGENGGRKMAAQQKVFCFSD